MRSRTGNLIGRKLSSANLFVGIWDTRDNHTEKVSNNWIDAVRLLVVKKTYTASTTTATFDFNPSLGGGSISFSGHSTFNGSTGWGPHYAHDNARTASDWCNLSGTTPLFGQWTFPKDVVVKNIFVIPRSGNDNFPTFVRVRTGGVGGTEVANNNTLETLTAGTSGHEINYTGNGYKIVLSTDIRDSVWRLEFGGSNAYIGEIEFWGYV